METSALSLRGITAEDTTVAHSFVWLWKVVAYKFALSAALDFYMAHT